MNDKIVVITGASQGLGKTLAIKLAALGAKVILLARTESLLSEIKNQITTSNGTADYFVCDVTVLDEVVKTFSKIIEKYSQIDILINNAGIYNAASLTDTPDELWQKIIDVNLKSVFLFSKEVAPHMLRKKKGKIINMASVAGIVGVGDSGAYCASKGGMVTLTKEMAIELAPQGINVNAICPGLIRTAMTKDMLHDKASLAMLKQQTLYPRFGEAEDIAYGALYLASDESDFVNGHSLVIDGGWTAH